MKIFICSKTTDSSLVNDLKYKIQEKSKQSIAVLQEKEHSEKWKSVVEEKLQYVDFVVFVLGEKTFDSVPMQWELNEAKKQNKRIIGIKLPNICDETLFYFNGHHVFDNIDNFIVFANDTFLSDRQLLLEQYKIMVGSTEKVTEQRLKVNNLFLAITSSILSISVVLGKTLNFSAVALIGMLLLTVISFMVSFFWEKLIRSYGKLNTGKFKVIDDIEKKLRTNMFEYEWNILKNEVKYESNTETEAKIVITFRRIILLILCAETVYLLYAIKILDYFESLTRHLT